MNARSYDPWKRLIDVTVSAVALLLTAPIQLALAACVRARLGSPVLFKQERPGEDEKIFTLVKFRTMLPVDERGGQVTDEQRMTKLGAFLRSTSLDELPTLWNVLKGDMSLVGPRPLLIQYLPLYSLEQRRRHEVRPGVTGLAQVSGRNDVSWETKFEMDCLYVDTHSLGLDLRILGRTLVSVLSRKGVSQQGKATVDYFEGTR